MEFGVFLLLKNGKGGINTSVFVKFEGNFLAVAAPPLTSTIAPREIGIFIKSYAFFALPKRQIKQSEEIQNEQPKQIPQLRSNERGNLTRQRIRYGGNHSVCGNAVSHRLHGNADAEDVHRFVQGHLEQKRRQPRIKRRLRFSAGMRVVSLRTLRKAFERYNRLQQERQEDHRTNGLHQKDDEVDRQEIARQLP